MTKEKTAEFLVDCLSNMPDQPEYVRRVVDTVIVELTCIANGVEWSEDEALASRSLWRRNRKRAAARAAADAAADAAMRSADCAFHWSADWAAYWAARANPDPAKERARQEAKRKELGL